MNIGRSKMVSSHEISQYRHGNCQLCDMENLRKPYILYQRTCCEYHSNIDLCIHSRGIRQLNSEINKPSDKNLPEMEPSISARSARRSTSLKKKSRLATTPTMK